MDSVSDKEVEAIWKRINRYINVKKIRSKTKAGIERELKDLMKSASEVDGSGSMQTLLKNNFPERASGINSIYEDILSKSIAGQELSFKPIQKKTLIPPVIGSIKSVKSGNKLPLKIKGRTRLYKPENINYTNSSYKGKAAYFIYNKRTGKRLTWGLYQER